MSSFLRLLSIIAVASLYHGSEENWAQLGFVIDASDYVVETGQVEDLYPFRG